MASFVDFLKTGRFGPVTAGMTEDEVREAFGEPRDVSVNRYPRIWKYGPLQLTFSKALNGSASVLASIVLYFWNPEERLPTEAALTDSPDGGLMNDSEFNDYLNLHGIGIAGGVVGGLHKHFVLPSSVRVTFDDDDRLYSVGYDLKRESEIKQVTVKVRRKDLDAIRKWAKGRGMSVSDLCSEWIKEQVSSLEKAPSP